MEQKYILVKGTIEDLADKVDEKIKLMYVPFGNVFSTDRFIKIDDTRYDVIFCQPMISFYLRKGMNK